MKKFSKYTNNGITLIALVVTIVVLLILAGVSISMLTGENGIITRANEAKIETEKAKEEELRKLTQAEASMHLEEYEYTDINGQKINIPAKCAVSQVEGENILENGLVIIDINGNEWVWIEIPKSVMPEEITFENEEDYTTLETALQAYTSEYRKTGWTDIWYSEKQHGFTSEETYDIYKNNILKSLYNNGGFWVGRYEVGTQTARSSANDILTTPIIKRDVYTYNYVTCKQAQKLSNQLAVGQTTSTLMLGLQWDLILKFIETKNEKTQNELKSDSITWGNYFNATFDITRGKYSDDYGSSYITVKSNYTKSNSNQILLTTGASERNSVLNIFDLAGNVLEWTLEYTSSPGVPCSSRGGRCDNNDSVFSRYNFGPENNGGLLGFRTVLFNIEEDDKIQ